MKTIFEQIISGEMESDKVWENDSLLVIRDIAPQAKVHLLLLPKKHWRCLQEVPLDALGFLMREIGEVTQMLAKKFGIEDGYRLMTNNGKSAGQVIFHLHFHLLGGELLSPLR